jgi:glycosyltransferase involved in cell wall biosynthesis
MLDQITPVVLTYNEAPNLERCLQQLAWAREVRVVDSFSTDQTLAIAARFPNVRLVQRRFDSHAGQWSFAVHDPAIRTPWVLALDADYVLSEALVDELSGLRPGAEVAGYRARFVYCVDGVALRGSLYPPVTVLFRPDRARYAQDGHTQRLQTTGEVVALQAPIRHDDRKPFAHWLRSQRRYARLEAAKLRASRLAELSWPDRVRRLPFASVPLAVGYCLLRKGCALDGRAGLVYTTQRGIAEALLALELVRGTHD